MNQSNLTVESIGKALRSALSKGIVRDEDTALIFYDLTFLEKRIRYLSSCFPPDTLHSLAIKANPLLRIMADVKKFALNTGVEAASVGELFLAFRSGYKPGQIVFDSPVKTKADLEFAIRKGIHLNIDNFSELRRVNEFLTANPPTLTGSGTLSGWGPSFGLRINPQIGLGSIVESSVAGEYSKFGIPINYNREALEHAYLSYPWLTGVHLHVGSQGCPLQMLVDGIGILYDFVTKMNIQRLENGIPPITIFDIGGGLPVSYHRGSEAPLMEDYVAAIRERAPGLFLTVNELKIQKSKIKTTNQKSKLNDPDIRNSSNLQIFKSSNHLTPVSFKIITEFGRWAYTNAGWTVSRVEYVKRDPAINTAMLHVGADLFVRECLNPTDWRHEYSVFDSTGRLKTGKDEHPYNLAGPLCFSGDIIAKGVSLPRIEEGDFLVIHDSGGYTFSMWSRYNSRQTPRITGYVNEGEQFEILKERESLEDLAGFWE